MTVAEDELCTHRGSFPRIDSHALQAAAAAIVLICSGHPGSLRFCNTDQGWLTTDEFVGWVGDATELTFLSGSDIPTERDRGSDVTLYPAVVWLRYAYSLIRETYEADLQEWPESDYFENLSEIDSASWYWVHRNSPIGHAISLLAGVWNVSEDAVLEASTFKFPTDLRVEVATRDGAPFKADPSAVVRRP